VRKSTSGHHRFEGILGYPGGLGRRPACDVALQLAGPRAERTGDEALPYLVLFLG